MLELSPARKNKINLTDYNGHQDIENRILMADFSVFEHDILEEILFNPLKLSLKKLARTMDCEENALIPVLEKLSKARLLSIQGDTILVDKERRKYFEFQIARFDPDFKPDMEFLQGILRKVPIHLLPIWYAIPRTSNNIFESIVEKHLLTPHIFHRYLAELNLGDPVLCGIIQEVFMAPDCKVASSDLIAKYNLSRFDFEEMLLFLEFNFVFCLTFERTEDHWVEWVTPFYEWHEYLRFLKATESPPIPSGKPTLRYRESDFAFIEDATTLLLMTKQNPIPIAEPYDWIQPLAKALSLPMRTAEEQMGSKDYIHSLIAKLCLVELAKQIDGHLHEQLDSAHAWYDMTLENRALYLYRHPLNHLSHTVLPAHIATERSVREAEKSIKRVLHGQWIFFEDFLSGVLVPLSENSVLALKRCGKHWKYTLPIYNEEEKMLIKAVVLEWLFETGMVAKGVCEGKDCFAVTPWGRFFFEEWPSSWHE